MGDFSQIFHNEDLLPFLTGFISKRLILPQFSLCSKEQDRNGGNRWALTPRHLLHVQSAREYGYIWHTAACTFCTAARSLSPCSRASLTWVSPSWRSVKAVLSAEDSSDRRSDSYSRTEELAPAPAQGCQLPHTSLHTCEHHQLLGTLVTQNPGVHKLSGSKVSLTMGKLIH